MAADRRARRLYAGQPTDADARRPRQALALQGSGVCQDHAHIFIAAARAARLSRPLRQRLSDAGRRGRAGGKPRLGGSACLGRSAGSASTSPTAFRPTRRYVRVATGRDYRDAMPVSGIRLGQAEERLAVTHHRGAVIQRSVAWLRFAGEFHDLLRRPEDRSRARVHVGHAHQCRHRHRSRPSARCISGRSPANASSC